MFEFAFEDWHFAREIMCMLHVYADVFGIYLSYFKHRSLEARLAGISDHFETQSYRTACVPVEFKRQTWTVWILYLSRNPRPERTGVSSPSRTVSLSSADRETATVHTTLRARQDFCVNSCWKLNMYSTAERVYRHVNCCVWQCVRVTVCEGCEVLLKIVWKESVHAGKQSQLSYLCSLKQDFHLSVWTSWLWLLKLRFITKLKILERTIASCILDGLPWLNTC